MRLMVAVVVGLALSSIPACFSPDLGNGDILCGSSGPACPSGYDCVQNKCYQHGTGGTGEIGRAHV